MRVAATPVPTEAKPKSDRLLGPEAGPALAISLDAPARFIVRTAEGYREIESPAFAALLAAFLAAASILE